MSCSLITVGQLIDQLNQNTTDRYNIALSAALSQRGFSLISTDGQTIDKMLCFFGFIKDTDVLFLYEIREYKNLWFVYPHTIMLENPDSIRETCELLTINLTKYLNEQYSQNNKLLKSLDFKILIYLPINISISGGYLSGPMTSNILNNPMPESVNGWYENSIKVNQMLHKYTQHPKKTKPQRNKMNCMI
jgi:hypothetical protein